MGCLSKVFKVRDFERKPFDEERNNHVSSGECSKGDSGTYPSTSSVANSGSYVVCDPRDLINNQAEVDLVVDGVGDDSLGTILTQNGSVRKPNSLRDFSYQELKQATKSFDRKCLLGEGGFGQVFKGTIRQKQKFGRGEEKIEVAVKQLNARSQQGHKEWLAEVHFLGLVECPHLVKLIGYCATDDDERGIQRLLVYEFMQNKGLDDHLFQQGPNCLSWASRVKIVLGAARGLAYLHNELEIQIIFRDFKTSNVLLDEDFEPKLSDFGLARQGPQDGNSHVSTVLVGTAGYAAPEYIQTGHLTVKSDVWSFGIVMLEVLTGRRVMDRNRPKNEQRLVEWAKPFVADHHKLFQIMDPSLKGRYPVRPAQKFAQLAYQCLQKFPKHRLSMSEVVEKLQIIQERTEQWQNPDLPSDLSQEFSRSSRDSPRAQSLGSLSNRISKISKFSPRMRHPGSSADFSKQISTLSLEGHSGAEPKPLDLSIEQPKPLDLSIEQPKLVHAIVEEPKPMDTTVQDPRPVDTTVQEPKPVDTTVQEPKLLDTTEDVSKLKDTPVPVNTSTEKPHILDCSGEQLKSVDISAEEPKLLGTVVEEVNYVDTAADTLTVVGSLVKDPKLAEDLKLRDTVVQGPKLGDTVAGEPKLGGVMVEKPKFVDSVVDGPKLGDPVVAVPKLVDSVLEKPKPVEDHAIVKRSSWGSERLARMSRDSGRFTWIPKLYGSLSS